MGVKMDISKIGALSLEELKSIKNSEENKRKVHQNITRPSSELTTESRLSNLRFSRLGNKV